MAKTPAIEVPPPDGGWGLIVAVSAHVMYVLAVGMLRCSGVFYTSWLHGFETSALQTATIGSVVGCCAFFGSPLAAVVCGRYGCRFTGILGGMVMVVGLFGSYWVRTIYQMYAVCAIAGRLYDDTRSYAVMFYAIAALFLAIIFQMAVLMPVLKKVDSAVRQNSKRNTESEHRV